MTAVLRARGGAVAASSPIVHAGFERAHWEMQAPPQVCVGGFPSLAAGTPSSLSPAMRRTMT
jgi:hypothetical protein